MTDKKIIDKKISEDSRPIAYEENGISIYRASAIGGGLRSLVASRLGYQPLAPPEYLKKAAQAGKVIEGEVVKALEKENYKVLAKQKEFNLPVSGAIIRGHIDGKILEMPILNILEIKSMSEKQFSLWKKHGFRQFPKYAAQICVYMLSFNLPAVYIVVPRNEWALDVKDLDIRRVNFPLPFSPRLLFEKIVKAEVYVRKEQLPEREKGETCDYELYHNCSFQYLCQGKY